MMHERVTEDEVHSAVRAAGGENLAKVESVILESDGTISVLLK